MIFLLLYFKKERRKREYVKETVSGKTETASFMLAFATVR